MQAFPPALAHGPLQEVFPDVFFVTGAMETVLQGSEWRFSRNMTVVREGERLVVINSVRLDEAGMAALDGLGRVTDVVRLGALHGRDDPYYIDRYPEAHYWQMPGMTHDSGLTADRSLSSEGPLPLKGATLFSFTTTRLPEGALLLDREGGIMIACDALQNWQAPDAYFSESSRQLMQEMGFFTPANVGPVWLQAAAPGAEDFARLKDWYYRHALCGHGEPLRDTASADFARSFNRLFGV
jgi:hypothetical protein